MAVTRVLITGTGDIATATAVRLFRAGFYVTLLAASHPLDIHYKRTYTAAKYLGQKEVSGIMATTAGYATEHGEVATDISTLDFVQYVHANRSIPILAETEVSNLGNYKFDYLFVAEDGLMSAIPDRITDNSILISHAGTAEGVESRYLIRHDDVYLGRVVYPFNKDSFIQTPGSTKNITSKENVKAPLEGVFTATCTVGAFIHEKQELGKINDIPILSPATGKISGLLNSGLIIAAGTVFAEICSVSNPLPAEELPPESYAIAGGVLEAILFDKNLENT